MQIIHTVLITLSIALVILNCHSADLEDNHNIETSLDAKSVDKELGDLNNKGSYQADRLGEKVQNNSDHNSIDLEDKDSIKVSGFNETGIEKKKEIDSDKAGDNTEKANSGSHGEMEQRTIEPERKVGLQDECDSSSNSCEIVDDGLVACLRVPGNESPDLSLLIQNKGKGTTTVTISSAPAFVQLETNQIEVLEKENKKVKVSIGNKGIGSIMVLKSGNGNCSLDFKELINQGNLKYISTSQITGIKISNSTSIVWITVLVAFLVLALLGTFICLWRKRTRSVDNKPKYDQLEMVLPPDSCRNKRLSDSKDRWDDNWDDSWDDVEAQKTSYVPRRINKEGWKD